VMAVLAVKKCSMSRHLRALDSSCMSLQALLSELRDEAWCPSRSGATLSHEPSNNTMNPTAGGASLLALDNRGGCARIEEVGPPAAGYGER
jgi:hypothetical protein